MSIKIITSISRSFTTRHALKKRQLIYESYDASKFQPGTKLFNEIRDIALTTYTNPYETILHTIHGSNRLYVLRYQAQHSPIVCCSFVQYGQELTLNGDNRKIPVIYHNLAISNENVKSTGEIKNLFKYVHDEIQKQKERQAQSSILFYYVTPAPSIIYMADQFVLNTVPSLENYNRKIFTDQEWHIVNELRKLRNWPLAMKSSYENPFVLKGVMRSRYTENERIRIKKIVERTNFKIFEHLGIDETNGDRLLRFGYV